VVVNGNVFREITRTALYNDVNFPALAQTWQALAAASSPSRTAASLTMSAYVTGKERDRRPRSSVRSSQVPRGACR
jgi:hypothetical protein